jgi:RNA polymerase sigma-70 factor (ECF subfamily)
MKRWTVQSDPDTPGEGQFVTTHWSMVLAAADEASAEAAEALEALCRTYWFPLYAFVRRQGHTAEEAQDLTQEFFCRFLEKNYLAQVRQEKGRFRSFLVAAMKHFLSNERARNHRLKRGGGRTILSLDAAQAEQRYLLGQATDFSPEKLYEHRWATAVMEHALARLRDDMTRAGKAAQFEALKRFLSADPAPGDYAAVAGELASSPEAVAVAVHRLRQQYLGWIRAEVARTVAQPGDIDGEVRHLYQVLVG